MATCVSLIPIHPGYEVIDVDINNVQTVYDGWNQRYFASKSQEETTFPFDDLLRISHQRMFSPFSLYMSVQEAKELREVLNTYQYRDHEGLIKNLMKQLDRWQ